MDDSQVTNQDAPAVAEPTQPVASPTTPDEPSTQPEQQPPAETPTDGEAAQTQTDVQVEEDEIEYPTYQIPQFQPLDINNLPVNDQNLIDPNALAGSINQSIAAAEERATMRAQQMYQEQRAEERNWEKAYEKYPDLKNNKELRDMVHNSRLGEVANLLSKTQDARSVKLPTPTQIADRFFKHLGTAKQDGMKQATENTVIQASAHVETSGRTSGEAEGRSKAFQNINNPNREVAKQARSDLLKSMVFGE